MVGVRECFVQEDNREECKQTTRRQHFVFDQGDIQGAVEGMYVQIKHSVCHASR